MKKIIIILLSLCWIFQLFADTLVGNVYDAENNKPVPSVYVKLFNPVKIAYTDRNGKFMFPDLNKGKYKIEFSRIGYQPQTREIKFPLSEKLTIFLKPESYIIEGIQITETRAKEQETPITFSNIPQTTIRENNFGQEIPLFLNEIPNVFSYSETGSNVGYSNLKVRGFDQKHIGVMINGIPLNDPEDHQVYWVNMPDFAETTSDIQFQRGVGSSLYGISTFGGSLNMETSNISVPEKIETFANYGTYKTIKFGAKLNKNFWKNYKLNLRLSKISSDGYRDNSASSMWSFFTNVSRLGERSVTELNIYGGNEKTHASWYAAPEDSLEINHHYNPISYENEIDNFSQPHFELHHRYYLNEKANIKNTVFYIRGKGYYEQYKEDEDLWEYGLTEQPDTFERDLIRQKWVAKNHYGWISQLNFQHSKGELTTGGYLGFFDSDHWGEIKKIISTDSLAIQYNPGQKYYEYTGKKHYLTFYLNESLKFADYLNIMTGLNFQNINYEFEQHKAGNFADSLLNSYEVAYTFIDPRLGINYNLNKNLNLYANLSYAQREPTDDELYDTWDGPDDLGVPPLFAHADTIFAADGSIKKIKWSNPYVKPEKLTDYEIGTEYLTGICKIKLNLFLMKFHDEIVPYGGVDDEGNPIRGNAEETIHRGIELSYLADLPYNFYLSGNISYNDNYFKKFIMFDWDENWNAVEKDFSGNKIAGFPDILANMKLSYKYNPFTIATQIQHVGKQYLDNTENEDRTISPFTLVNAYLIYKFGDKRSNLELSLRVNNIFNLRYETSGYYDSWDGKNYLFPAAGRNIILGVRMGF